MANTLRRWTDGVVTRAWRAQRGILSVTARATVVVAVTLIALPCNAGIDLRISGVTEELEKNIREFLSYTRYAARDDLDEELMARLGRRVPTEVRRALEPLGYYNGTATYTIAKSDKTWRVDIAVDPGRAVRISEAQIEIQGEGANDKALQAILQRKDLHPGGRLDHGVYESLKAELLRTALNRGYLDATLARHEFIVDPGARRAQVFLTLDTRARYRFGAIDITQPVLKDKVARRLLRMQEGDPYSLDAILESQYLFDDSQYFSNVEFAPGDPNRETREVPLSVHADRNKRNRYAVSAGYGTDTDARGKLTWDNRYLNSRGHRSQIELLGSSVLEEIRGKYIVPVMDVALEKVEADAGVAREELGDLLSKRRDLSLGLTQVLGSWQRVLFVRFSREDTELLQTETTDTSDSTVPTGTTFLIIPGVSFATIPPNLLDNNKRRYNLYTELTGSPQTLGSDATFLQLRVSGERVFDLTPRWRTRLRGQLGVTWSDDFDTLPASHRFFAGGDNSVRGFGLNELSPLDDKTKKRVGGRYLAVASTELERDIPNPWLPDALSGAVFFDIGNAFNHFSGPYEYSVGVGLRYRLAGVASIGVDVAQALSDNRSPRLHLRLATLF